MSCNPSSLREVETFRGLVPGVTDTVRLGYSQRKKGLSPWLSAVEKMTKNEQTSYIFAKCKGERAHTISQIEHIPNVESATPVTGRFDLVIKLGTNEPTKAFTTMEKMRDIPSIEHSDNHLVREHHQQLQQGRQREPPSIRSLESQRQLRYDSAETQDHSELCRGTRHTWSVRHTCGFQGRQLRGASGKVR